MHSCHVSIITASVHETMYALPINTNQDVKITLPSFM